MGTSGLNLLQNDLVAGHLQGACSHVFTLFELCDIGCLPAWTQQHAGKVGDEFQKSFFQIQGIEGEQYQHEWGEFQGGPNQDQRKVE